MKVGDKVKFSPYGCEELLVYSEDHYKEFMYCVGIVEKIEDDLVDLMTVYTEVTVRWIPSKLNYIYPKSYLEIIK